jgi:diaminobutyrate-2-oxoglutarate transaminase
LKVIEELESDVRLYSRLWPAVFNRAQDSFILSEDGRSYLDFFAGAGALNYGHNNSYLKTALIDYLNDDGIIHSLDMATTAKISFLSAFSNYILAPRNLDYKVQFTGPTGANAVEAALKIARRISKRPGVVCFTNAFHGMSLGALAVTGNEQKRAAAGVSLPHTVRIPYDGFCPAADGLELLDAMLRNGGCGLDRPGAVIVETVQGEGGVKVARPAWLRSLAALCTEHRLLLIVDDIQVGCGRTGGFFSFEEAGLTPDIVCLSKSISGYGLPMAIVLLRPELDQWKPGEHSGTFRGNNLAFVAATAALTRYWHDGALEAGTHRHAAQVTATLASIAGSYPAGLIAHQGRGLIHGLTFSRPLTASAVSRRAFELGLLVETSGPRGEVVKLLPPLTISAESLSSGLEILTQAVKETVEL